MHIEPAIIEGDGARRKAGGGGEVTCGGDAVEKNRPPVSVFMGETSILEALGRKNVFFDLQERLLSRPPGPQTQHANVWRRRVRPATHAFDERDLR